MITKRKQSRRLLCASIAISALCLCSQGPAAGQVMVTSGFIQHNLVSDLPGMAITTDPNLKNPWGVAFGSTSPFWIADNGTGVSTLYNGQAQKIGLTVTIPPPGSSEGPAAPTGMVFNPTKGFRFRRGEAPAPQYSSSLPRMAQFLGGTRV